MSGALTPPDGEEEPREQRAKTATPRPAGERGGAASAGARFRRGVRRWLGKAFFENSGLKFVAFVLALTVFILVHSDEDVVIGAYVGVSYTMPTDRVLVSTPVDQVRLSIRGSRRQIRNFDERELPRLHVDLRSRTSGEFLFHKDMFRLPEGLELVDITPSSMPLVFERRDEKPVPIQVSTLGRPADGYKIQSITVTPRKVAISGAESAVATVKEVRTREIVLDGRTKPFRETVSLVDPRDHVEFVSDRFVRVDVEIAPEQTSRDFGKLPVSVAPGAGVPAGAATTFQVAPAQVEVTVRGPIPTVQKLSPGDLHAVVKLFADDVSTQHPREADVVIEGLPDSVTPDVQPQQVELAPTPTKPAKPAKPAKQ